MAEIQCAYTELKPIHKLQPHPENPHKHSPEQIDRLAQLIDYQGIRHPVIVSKRSGFIVAGHGRLEALKKLNVAEVPIDYQDFDDEAQEYAFIVSDNAIGKDEWAALDLLSIRDKLKTIDLDINLMGLNEKLDVEPIDIELQDFDFDHKTEKYQIIVECVDQDNFDATKELLGITSNKISHALLLEKFNRQ